MSDSVTEPGADIESPVLFAMEGNSIPEGTVSGHILTPDGKRLRYAHFEAQARPLRGTIILLHGRNESIEKYFETIRDFSAAGYVCATFDWRGQGDSDRALKDRFKGHIEDFDEYVTDLETFFTEIVLPDCPGPYHIVAHSTGSLVALLASPNMANRVNRMVLSAPLLGISRPPLSQGMIAFIANILTAIGYGTSYLGNGPRPAEAAPFMGNKLTSDHRRYMRNSKLYQLRRDLALGGPTATWVHAALEAIEKVSRPDFIAGIHIPVLILAAGADEVVPVPAIENYARRMRSGSLITIDGARHELMQEADAYREPFIAAALAYLSDGRQR